MQKPIEEYSDSELLVILRRAENTNVPGSQYQRANTEWQIRQQNKLIEASKSGKGGIFFAVGGDMKNDGLIHTDQGATVDITVGGKYISKKGKIIQGNLPQQTQQEKTWHEKPLGIILLTVIAGIMIGGILFWLGWV